MPDHFRITLTSILPGRVGGLTRWHPAIIADGSQMQDSTAFRMRLAVLEDGGRLITVHTMMPEEIAESSFDTLSHCILSFELADPKGPTTALVPEAGVPAMDVIEHDPEMPMQRDANEVWMRALHKKLEAAVLKAQPFLAAQHYDEAEQVVKEVGADIYGAVAIGKMYTESLRSIVGPDKRGFDQRRAEELFIRALCWRQSAYPDAHTSYEAEQYEAGRTEDLNELVTILGSAPSRA